ncbi:MAG: hypothetical protein ACPGVD_09965 [Flavobacteriales bacterium]
MKKLGLLILILFTFVIGNSQFYKKHEDNKLKFYGTLDFRTASFASGTYSYYGVKMGVTNKSIRFGASYHFFHRNLFSAIQNSSTYFTLSDYGFRKTEYHILSLFTELIAHQTPRWELLIPIHLGTGYFNQYEPSIPKGVLILRQSMANSGQIHSLVISAKANYRIAKWAGLTAGFGHISAFSQNNQLESELTHFFVSFGIKLFFDEFGTMFNSREYRKKYMWEPNFVKKYEQTTN